MFVDLSCNANYIYDHISQFSFRFNGKNQARLIGPQMRKKLGERMADECHISWSIQYNFEYVEIHALFDDFRCSNEYIDFYTIWALLFCVDWKQEIEIYQAKPFLSLDTK